MALQLQRPISLGELATALGGELTGTAVASTLITQMEKIDAAGPGSISFLANPLYKKYLSETTASAVIISAKDAVEGSAPMLVVKNPRLALAKLLHLCAPEETRSAGVHPTAIVGRNVKIGENVSIGPYCVIGDDCEIGDNTKLMPSVTVYARTKIGKNCAIHSSTVLGSDGFGYEMDHNGTWVKMLHLGGLIIGDNVEIGSNTSIDRGMMDNTIIGNHVIIDNQVQLGHNVVIGDGTAIAGCVGIAGSTTIGKYCLIGGASNIAGHIELADRVYITATSSVSNSISTPGVYSSGLPARENGAWRRSVARFMTLDNMAKRIRELEQKFNTATIDENNQHGF
jgi:UDP-3-O-[3-hydroxymyristoyl] glucosamine N-acyltransferase